MLVRRAIHRSAYPLIDPGSVCIYMDGVSPECGSSLLVVLLCCFLGCIDVYGRSEGPLWRTNVWVNGLQFSHVFREVSGDVFEV
jgi:hypothetical protein